MSTPLFLVCHATRECVHVAESSGSWFRGADYSILVGAFCEIHMDKPLVILTAEGIEAAEAASAPWSGTFPYTEWTRETFEELIRGSGDRPSKDRLIRQLVESFAEADDEYRKR